jgi:hypothetical protein
MEQHLLLEFFACSCPIAGQMRPCGYGWDASRGRTAPPSAGRHFSCQHCRLFHVVRFGGPGAGWRTSVVGCYCNRIATMVVSHFPRGQTHTRVCPFCSHGKSRTPTHTYPPLLYLSSTTYFYTYKVTSCIVLIQAPS